MENLSGLGNENGAIVGDESNSSGGQAVPAGGVNAVPIAGACGDAALIQPGAESDSIREFLGVRKLMKISWRMLKPRSTNFLAIILSFISLIVVAFMLSFLSYGVFENEALSLLLGILTVIFFLSVCFVYGIVFIEIVGDKDIKVRDAVRRAFPRIIPYLKVTLVSLVAFLDLLIPLVLAGVLYAIMVITSGAVGFDSGHAGIYVIDWILGLSTAVYILLLFPLALLLGVWEKFAFFALIVDGKPALESAVSAYGMIKHRKRGIVWRMSVFAAFYYLIMTVLTAVAGDSRILIAITWIVSYLLVVWMYMYAFVMYENLKPLRGAETDLADMRTVKKIINTGVGCVALAILSYALITMFASAVTSSRIPENSDTTGVWGWSEAPVD